ncbi:NAD(P)/FAD-dependent oxidoreductase [Phenylobacterium sp.]|uniref:flavin-containing monooxygenase n=1 Tax=Phenylobacterium sp. TaxID=1871053 RepID=UPI00262D7537|nr:NAD(P)/FAD-dependent oxidoreductase [Phenylobacterium sp.]
MTIRPEIAEIVGEIDFDPDALHEKYLAERDKRLRPDGISQYVEVTAEFSHFVEDPYVEPGFTREPVTDEVEFAIIGGGFGGLLMGARLREAGFRKIRMVEAGGDFGGTWYWNRYPGAMCDVESYVYLPLLEELNYIPRHKYSFAPEILEHSRRIATHYRLYDDALLQTKITGLVWDEAAARWIVETDRGDRFRAQYVAMANGPLSRPKLPGIPGINDFQGHTFHTSRWDYRYTGGSSEGGLSGLSDKRVGIIGTGATAIQCVPHLGEWAKQLYVFQRTPSSVDVRNNAPTDPEWVKTLTPGWQRRRMENFNILVSGGDQDEDLVSDGWTDIFRNLTGTAAKAAARKLGRRLTSEERGELMALADYRKMNQVRARVDQLVKDPETAAKLKPWYRQFCKRPCFHDEYLQTFNRENVHLVDTNGTGVERLTATGVVANGVEYEVDCLIFATGFEVGTSYTRRAGYDIVGRGGQSLSEHWADGLRTLHGLTSHGFPNCFFLGFTQTAVTVSVPMALYEQAEHVTHIVTGARARGAQVVEPTAEAEADYVAEVRSLARMGQRFYAECTPGYYNSEGAAGNRQGFFSDMYGAGSIAFFEKLRAWRAAGDLPGIALA